MPLLSFPPVHDGIFRCEERGIAKEGLRGGRGKFERKRERGRERERERERENAPLAREK